MIDIEKTSEFLNDIKSIDNIEKIKKQKSKLLKLLNLLLKEINNDIDINSLKNLKESQIWAFIFNNSSKTINDYKSQLKNYQDILNELNEYNEENDINKNILGKKIKRNKEDNENKNEEDIEDNENEDIEEFEEMEENEDIKEEDDNFGNKKDIFFSMKDLNNFADQFEEEDNNMNENNDNNNKIKSAPNRLKLSSSRKNNNKKNISEENEEDEEEEDNENNSLYSEEQEIKADINSDEEIKFDKFFDKPEKKLRNIDTSENSDFDENEIFTQIKEIEEKMISKKEWSTKGEVLGKERPKDSLLTKAMDFEVGLKAPPIPDREYTDKLENMIKQRILDDLFDDPIKKNIINLNEEKKADNDELNFEKSKKGLGEIYEEKYLGNEKTENKVDEIKKECDDLCNKLFDIFKSMTNGSATPYGLKGKKEQDINIINIPAIQIEDIGNFISDNKEKIKSGKELYNPNKIRRKNKEEMTSDELRNIHNKKKRNIKSRIHKKENKKKMEELTQMLGSKFEAKIRMKQEKNKRIEKIDKTQGKEYKSGKFFGKINEMAEKEEEKKKKNNKITE